MKNINKLSRTRRNKNNKNKHLEFKNQTDSLSHLKDLPTQISNSKFKSAGSVSFNNTISRSFDNKKSDVFFDNLITIEELAHYIGVSQKTIRNWISLRSIPFLRIGKKTFFRYEKISSWLQTKEFEPCL